MERRIRGYAVQRSMGSLTPVSRTGPDRGTFPVTRRPIVAAGSLSGTWSESGRGVSGTRQGRGGSDNFQVIVIPAERQFGGASITLSRR
jgi:hypothetical protein